MAEQDFPKDKYELIFIEQRSRESSDQYNHSLGFKSLRETADNYSNRMNIRVIFLNMNNNSPYHVGVCNNRGILEARGKYVSVMDGDLLVKPDFLSTLEEAHRDIGTIINLDRRYAIKPVDVDFDNWTKGTIDFEECLKVCRNYDQPIRKTVENKGPLISAPKQWWEAIGGYDEHRIWSTGVTRLGLDVTVRMEIYANCQSLALPGQLCVHPYHPAGFDRSDKIESIVLSAQKQLIDFATSNGEPLYTKRKKIADKLYRKYKWAFNANITGELGLIGRIKLYHARLNFRKGLKRIYLRVLRQLSIQS
ncbi:glycosyltransferase [Thermodesulfobacteriota bacterium]